MSAYFADQIQFSGVSHTPHSKGLCTTLWFKKQGIWRFYTGVHLERRLKKSEKKLQSGGQITITICMRHQYGGKKRFLEESGSV